MSKTNEIRKQAIRDAAKRLREGGGFIYVATWKDGLIKIGCALDPANRMKTLRIDYLLAETPRLLASVPGTISQERSLHRRLNRFLRRSDRRAEVYPASILLHPELPDSLRGAA